MHFFSASNILISFYLAYMIFSAYVVRRRTDTFR